MIEAVQERLLERTSRGLATAVGDAIRDGALAEGQRLPPIRTVARELSLSTTTVSAAWNALVRAGALRTDGRRGTTVATRPTGPARYRNAVGRTQRFELDLSSGVPDEKLLPDMRAALRSVTPATTRSSYLDDPTVPELLEVASADWPYAAEKLAVVDGAMDALQQIVSVLIRFGSTVLVEHPCFPPFLDLLESAGARVVGVPMDEHGLIVDELRAVAPQAQALILQPRAHNPTGISMSRQRAGELAAALEGTQLVVIEDDSAGPLALAEPLSLGAWLPDRVLHVRSYSKSHGPDLRIAVISGPGSLMTPLEERRYLGQGWTSRILQALLLHHLTSESSQRKVLTARETYAARRTSVQDALRVRGVPTVARDGLNIWLPVRDEVAAMVRLASRGIGVASGAPFLVANAGQPHLRVTVGLVRTEHTWVANELADAADLGGWSSMR